MNLTCQHNFAVRYKRSVNQDHTFSADICFKEGEDLEITTEKLFKQDGISSVYFKDGYSDMISYVNCANSLAKTELLLQKYYEEPSLLKDITNRWEKHFEEKEDEKKNQEISNNFHRLSPLEVEKFIKILSDNKTRFRFTELAYTFRLHIRKAKELYEANIERLNEKHTEDIEIMAAESADELEINNKVQQHLNQLEEEKNTFEKKINEITKENVKTLKEKIAIEYERIGQNTKYYSESEVAQSKATKTVSKRSKTSINSSQIPKFKIQVLLGQQKKYQFKVKLVQTDVATFLEQEKAKNVFGTNQKTQLIETIKNMFKIHESNPSQETEEIILTFLNPFCGAFGSALVNSLPLDGKNWTIKIENTLLDNFLKYEPDLHFESYETQIKENTKGKILEGGDIVVSLHSNLGFIKYVFNLIEDTGLFNKGSGALESYLYRLLIVALEKRIRKVIIPLELMGKKKMMMGNNETNNIIEGFTKVIRGLKMALQLISQNYLSCDFLYELIVVIQKGETEQDFVFNKCKEILKNTFE